MNRWTIGILICCATAITTTITVRAAEQARQLVERAPRLASAGDSAQAVQLASEALAQDAKLASAYYIRGSEHFRLGKINASVADFDQYVKLQPQVEPRMWKRGISYYYAKKYDAGAKQFELYQTYHDNDVENSVWRYLCVRRAEGARQARESMLPIRNDTRVPMMQIYEMFRGQSNPAEVLRVAQASPPSPQALNQRLFYAHLYIGLYYESEGQMALAKRHITSAAENHKIGHYMWDVANIHAKLLRKNDQANPEAN